MAIMKNSALLSLLILSMATLSLSFQFQVGGDKGWIKPPANKTNVYNNWARQTRFQVGDTVYFKYANDSVLVVNEADYKACNVNNPVWKHTDGKTVIELDHHGVFYFISGNAAHCKAGQKLIIDVLADHYGETETPSPALAPAPGGSGHWHASGQSGGGGVSGGDSWMPKSSAAELTVSSAVMSFMVVGYMFL
ncbi:hypothetical protein QQ045_009810 [Rhodiola kirilowii]